MIVIGSALGTLQNSVSRGIVSGLRNSGGVTLVQIRRGRQSRQQRRADARSQRRVVGIRPSGYKGQQGLNFAVAIDHARDILEGRQTNLGSGQAGLSNLAPMVPGGEQRPEADRRQQQGEQEFAAANQRRRNRRRPARRRVDSSSAPAVTSRRSAAAYDREWFAVFAPGAIPGDAASGCIGYYQEMTAEMNKFRAFMRQTVESARRAGVLPGIARDTLRSKRLNSDAWDR